MDPTLTWAHIPSNGGWVVCQKMSHKKSGTNNISHDKKAMNCFTLLRGAQIQPRITHTGVMDMELESMKEP